MYPVKLLLCKHLGSVIAGSFMTGFFSIPDLIFDLLKPDENAHSNAAYIFVPKFEASLVRV